MIDVRAQGKESLKGVGDVRFDLLWRHAIVKSGHHHHRHIDLWKKVDWHTGDVDHANQQHDQAHHDDEEGVAERKLRHYCSPPSSSCKSIVLPASRVTSRAGLASTTGVTRSPS